MQPDDLAPIFTMKMAQKYENKQDLKAMQAVAKALKDRSLEAFEKNLKDYTSELQHDQLIRTHLAHLYDTLLEQNLVRVLEPYSVVDLAHVAQEVGQPVSSVESK